MDSTKQPPNGSPPEAEDLQQFFSDLLSEANRLGEALPGYTPTGEKLNTALNAAVAQGNEAIITLLTRIKTALEAYPDDAHSMSFTGFLDAHPEILGIGTSSQYFHMLVQGKAANKLQKRITQKITDPAQLDLYGNGSIIEADFRLFIHGYREIAAVRQTAAMLLDSLMIQATKEGLQNTLVHLPLQEYMAMRGLKDEKETRNQTKRDLLALERIHFEYKGTGERRKEWLKISIAGGTVGQIRNGDIIFRFNQDWFDSFRASDTGKLMYMYFPKEALQANVKYHPYTYWLARKLAEHKRMNIGKSNEDIIGVDTLIAACPNFPTYADVMAGNRNVTQRIIEPFERDMDELKESLSWHYTESEPPSDYQSFIATTVTVNWNDYPDVKKLETAKANRARRIAATSSPKSKHKPTNTTSKKEKKGG